MFVPRFDPNALFSQIRSNYLDEMNGIYGNADAFKNYAMYDMVNSQYNDEINQLNALKGLTKNRSIQRRIDQQIAAYKPTDVDNNIGILNAINASQPNLASRWNQIKAQGQVGNMNTKQWSLNDFSNRKWKVDKPTGEMPKYNISMPTAQSTPQQSTTTTNTNARPRPTVYGSAVSRYLAKLGGGVVASN
jgi:hypothetical protein